MRGVSDTAENGAVPDKVRGAMITKSLEIRYVTEGSNHPLVKDYVTVVIDEERGVISVAFSPDTRLQDVNLTALFQAVYEEGQRSPRSP